MIEANIENWLRAIIPEATDVLRAPTSDSRPVGDYLTYQIISAPMNQYAFKKDRIYNDATERIEETKSFCAQLMVSINCYSPMGMYWMTRISGSWADEQTRDILHTDGEDLNINQIPASPRNLTNLGTEGYRHRWQGDISILYTAKTTQQIYRLKEFIITGRWVEGAGGDIQFRHEVNLDTITP